MVVDHNTLRRNLIDARYKILVAIRPVAPARAAFDLMVSAVITSLPASEIEAIEDIRSLKFNME